MVVHRRTAALNEGVRLLFYPCSDAFSYILIMPDFIGFPFVFKGNSD